ncbi:hypothetical protein Nepgr_002328 [Nepenthes gracilis]|uniref:UDP-rhamnose:rhamnosyltransferase 1 n=1 Tax=Nepenthes gracilis TaxID=150966 RepID=A0AAD3P9J1_NEPGR|nr:hypothetical protein Nepgr_002328 [Nepenthes gracilis]
MAKDLHAVVLPWFAFGHMIPCLQLSIALAKAGVHVSYVAAPRNIQRLPRIPPSVASLVKYVELPLPAVGGLPDGAEATVDLPFEKIQYLKVAYDLLKHPFKHIIENQSPDWIITDWAASWTVDIARECSVPLLLFSVFSAAGSCFVGPPKYLVGEGQKRERATPESLTSPPTWVEFPSSVALRGHEAVGFHAGFYGENASGITDAERFAKLLQGVQAVSTRSCMEFEGSYIDLLQKITNKPVIPAGLLPPEQEEETESSDVGKRGGVFKWLHEQNPKSVVFVGFGSEYMLTRTQVHEIAYGLELSQLPFLWALRKPDWAIEDSNALPSGFRDRTRDKGMVCLGWAPQQKILAHPSVGGSLFHSGWGSIIETLQYGHNLVVLPFIIDQGLNARLVVEKGLAIEVDRREDGSFSRDDIAKALTRAMVEEEGERLRVRTTEAAAIFGDQKLHQNLYIGGLVEYMKNGTRRH